MSTANSPQGVPILRITPVTRVLTRADFSFFVLECGVHIKDWGSTFEWGDTPPPSWKNDRSLSADLLRGAALDPAKRSLAGHHIATAATPAKG